MKTTTIYRETLTITTDDDGAQHITRSHTADTETEYYFTELTPEAQQRAIEDAIEDEQETYYEYGIYGCSQTGMSEREIWDAAEDLEKHQPIYIGTDAGGTPCGKARRYGWSRPDWQSVTEQADTGIVYSMDICDTWNAYAARIVALQEGYEEAEAEAWRLGEEADRLDDASNNDDIPDAMRDALRITAENVRAVSAEYERICERIENAAEELTEDAARAVGDTIDGLIEAERDYYTSAEFWREWLADDDDRFTRDGERI